MPRKPGQGRNYTHYDQQVARELAENHQTVYIFDAGELLKEANTFTQTTRPW